MTIQSKTKPPPTPIRIPILSEKIKQSGTTMTPTTTAATLIKSLIRMRLKLDLMLLPPSW